MSKKINNYDSALHNTTYVKKTMIRTPLIIIMYFSRNDVNYKHNFCQ